MRRAAEELRRLGDEAALRWRWLRRSGSSATRNTIGDKAALRWRRRSGGSVTRKTTDDGGAGTDPPTAATAVSSAPHGRRCSSLREPAPPPQHLCRIKEAD
uniref:Uncharacterized protein n=1 Tax=Oryza sativa subsp. japonica TaxID=39947 RepID=Q6YXZ8_ORYSJ|nr:hypothetical protein [Oryza sativa Japonica Group]BAD17502.1 hypothetical protein [Oryza sativa Japonica Group]